jgi:hypothetical protein
MSVRPVGSVPKNNSPASAVRKKPVDAAPGADANFAELTTAPVQEAPVAPSAQRDPANGNGAADGDAIANIAAAYLIFGGGTTKGGPGTT